MCADISRESVLSKGAAELLQRLQEVREKALQDSDRSELTARERERMESFGLQDELRKNQGSPD